MYTLEDYEKARAGLWAVQARRENSSGSNPDNYQADLKASKWPTRSHE
jgi:hypothetical protein